MQCISYKKQCIFSIATYSVYTIWMTVVVKYMALFTLQWAKKNSKIYRVCCKSVSLLAASSLNAIFINYTIYDYVFFASSSTIPRNYRKLKFNDFHTVIKSTYSLGLRFSLFRLRGAAFNPICLSQSFTKSQSYPHFKLLLRIYFCRTYDYTWHFLHMRWGTFL